MKIQLPLALRDLNISNCTKSGISTSNHTEDRGKQVDLIHYNIQKSISSHHLKFHQLKQSQTNYYQDSSSLYKFAKENAIREKSNCSKVIIQNQKIKPPKQVILQNKSHKNKTLIRSASTNKIKTSNFISMMIFKKLQDRKKKYEMKNQNNGILIKQKKIEERILKPEKFIRSVIAFKYGEKAERLKSKEETKRIPLKIQQKSKKIIFPMKQKSLELLCEVNERKSCKKCDRIENQTRLQLPTKINQEIIQNCIKMQRQSIKVRQISLTQFINASSLSRKQSNNDHHQKLITKYEEKITINDNKQPKNNRVIFTESISRRSKKILEDQKIKKQQVLNGIKGISSTMYNLKSEKSMKREAINWKHVTNELRSGCNNKKYFNSIHQNKLSIHEQDDVFECNDLKPWSSHDLFN